MVTEFFLSWLELATLEFERFFLPMVGDWQKRQEQCEGREFVDKRAVKSGRVGERAKEALVDGLDGFRMACQ